MFSSISMKGDSGKLKFKYLPAAELATWNLTGDSHSWVITAKIKSVDETVFDLSDDLDFIVAVKDKIWSWPVHIISRDENELIFSGKGGPKVK